MSPVNLHLEWAEVSNFAPGLWTQSASQMPPTAAQTMTDCLPSPGGGLRAALKPSTTQLPATGLAADLIPLAIFAVPLFIGNLHFLFGYVASTNVASVWTLNQNAGETSWTLRKSHTANANSGCLGQNSVDYFVDSAGQAHVVYAHFSSAADGGVWSATVVLSGAPVFTHRLVETGLTLVATQDDRLIAVTDDASLFQRVLRFTDSLSISSWPAANTISVQAGRLGSVIQTITPFAPSDFLVGMTGAPWVNLQGGITDPLVRGMSDAVTPQFGHRPAFTEGGLVFASEEGVYLTGDGQDFQELSGGLATYALGRRPQLAYSDHLLLGSLGYTFDFESQSWYRMSNFTSGRVNTAVRATRQILGLTTDAAGFGINTIFTGGLFMSQRWNTYTWKSAPFRDAAARRIRIREVQLSVNPFDSGSQVAVTVGGTTITRTGLSPGPQIVSFLFDKYAESLDVQVVPTAGTSTNEAPQIEVVRIGHHPQHQAY